MTPITSADVEVVLHIPEVGDLNLGRGVSVGSNDTVFDSADSVTDTLTRHDHHQPLSRLWLRGLFIQAWTLVGNVTPFIAQQLTAYYIYQRRLLTELPGDALQDWLEAADMLNECAEDCRFPRLIIDGTGV